MRPASDQHVTVELARAGLARVRATVAEAAARAGRDPAEVTLVAAVKYVDAASCAALVAAGVTDLAENRFEQLVAKQDPGVVAPEATWHFIGRLQSREAPRIVERVSLVHSLCTTSAARRIDTALSSSPDALHARAHARALVQVNVDGDPGKDGLAPHDVPAFLEALPATIRVEGFMAMPAFAADPEGSRAAFSALRELRDRLAPTFTGRHELAALSMGTSQDLAVAVEEGATHVRLGRILYEQVE